MADTQVFDFLIYYHFPIIASKVSVLNRSIEFLPKASRRSDNNMRPTMRDTVKGSESEEKHQTKLLEESILTDNVRT